MVSIKLREKHYDHHFLWPQSTYFFFCINFASLYLSKIEVKGYRIYQLRGHIEKAKWGSREMGGTVELPYIPRSRIESKIGVGVRVLII